MSSRRGVRARRASGSIGDLLLIGVAATVLPVCVLQVLTQGLGPSHPVAQAVEQAGRARAYSVKLVGPNDGEPINSRLELKLQTDFLERGSVNVEVQGILVHTQDLLKDSFIKDGYRYALIVLNVQEVGKLIGADLLNPDAGPLRVSVTVLNVVKTVLGGDSWSGIVGKPWIDFPIRIIVGADGKEQSAVPTRAVVYPLRTDILYILFAAQDRSLLTRTPDDPKLLHEARVVSSGPYYSPPAGKPSGSLVYLDAMAATGWKATYFVLWTYDSEGGWKRSSISGYSR